MILYNPTISGSLAVTGSLTTTGTITSQTLVVQTITSSIDFVTGSAKFGSLSTNTHQFTGSVGITGSNAALLNINNGVLYVSASGNVGIGTTSPSQLLEVVGGEIKAGRVDSVNEGGQVSFGRSTDNATAWYIDTYGNVASPQLRFVDVTGAAVRMTLTGSNVGIGTSSPSAKLNIAGGDRGTSIRVESSTNAGVALYNSTTNKEYQLYSSSDSSFTILDNTVVATRFKIGSLGFTASTKTASDADSKTFMNSVNETCGLIPVPAGTTLYLYSRDSSTNYRVLLTSSTYFTGQHGNKPINLDLKTNIQNYIGMIVSSNGTYHSVNPITQEATTGKDAIQISEALPEIKLTDVDQDKAVWGVVTNTKNDNYNTDGTIETDNNTEWGDRLGSDVIRVNGLGEGAIWITNINGNIENGDYICSSVIPGYGRKQNDDLLHNYTVAKSTMNCNFDLNNDGLYVCEEFQYDGTIYKKAFIGCTYHCS
jgi:hypothetical protein